VTGSGAYGESESCGVGLCVADENPDTSGRKVVDQSYARQRSRAR